MDSAGTPPKTGNFGDYEIIKSDISVCGEIC